MANNVRFLLTQAEVSGQEGGDPSSPA